MSDRDPSVSRRWGPASRDAAVRRVRRATGLVVVGATALSGVFSVVAAHAFKGHSRKTPAATAATADRTQRVAVAPPQYVPAISGRHATPRPPSSAPAPAPTQQSAPTQQAAPAPAPTQQAAPAPAPAPAPPPPPPVTSGGS